MMVKRSTFILFSKMRQGGLKQIETQGLHEKKLVWLVNDLIRFTTLFLFFVSCVLAMYVCEMPKEQRPLTFFWLFFAAVLS